MASELPRTVVVTSNEQRGPVRRFMDTLSNRFSQNVETRSRSPTFRLQNAGVDRVRPARDLTEYRAIAFDVPIVRKALTDFCSDVVKPGYRIETDNDEVREYLQDVWCPQAAIVGGGKHHDLMPFLRSFVFERWRGGDALAEHVRSDPNDPDSLFTGLHLINPEHVEYATYEDKNVLIDPDATDDPDVDPVITNRGEAAAYIQFGSKALVSTGRDAIALSQNDVTRSVLDPEAGELRGVPITQTIAKDVSGFLNILRDQEEAIKSKAWGIWEIGFGRDTIEYTEIDPETGESTDVTEIIEWDADGQADFVDTQLNNIEPGAILTHDGVIDMDRLDGDVPDLMDLLMFYVSNIVSALPTPLYVVGFEKNINQFVTEGQGEQYQDLVSEERQEIERTFSDTMRRVVEKNLVENAHQLEDGSTVSVSEVPDDLSFKIQPRDEESPILSLTDDEVARMERWANAFESVRGDLPVEFFAEPETLAELILQLPEDAIPDDLASQIESEIEDDDIDADDAEEVEEEVESQFAMLMNGGDD